MRIERRNFLRAAAFAAAPAPLPDARGGACIDDATLLSVQLAKQLFFDNLLLESVQDITRELHQPRKFEGNPLIVKDKPWEHVIQFRTSGYTIIRDPKDKIFRAWYTDEGFTNEIVRRGITWPPYRSLYACSDDGIHWQKPALGIYREGGLDTNIFSTGFDERTMLLDPSEPDGPKRFKSIGYWAPPEDPEKGHIQATYSADGVHWKNYDEPLSFGKFGPHLGDSTVLSYDSDNRVYVLTTRHSQMGTIAQNTRLPRTKSFLQPFYPENFARMEKRRIFQSESSDFIHWNEPKLLLYPDAEDNLDDYLYGMQQFRNPGGDTQVGLLNLLHSVPDAMDVQLAYSLDDRCWKRLHKRWLPVGPAGAWDQVMVECTNAPIVMGDELWFYYGGSGWGHHDWYITGFNEGLKVAEARDVTKVGFFLGLAKLRLDGFCSLNAGPVREGIIVTRELNSPGTGIIINAECGQSGYIDAEIMNQADEVIPGYSRKESERFTGNAVRHQLSWQSKTMVPPQEFRRVVFYMRNAKIYSLQFTTE